ncbi:GNAT family N-acetyltransferase [Thalassovita taeanensis]|uniref:Acetyltransferase (GNAT) domain-containing protein n=1 Tax=Thalassovita taeanensis TaxID=657014 RepID=A0A1H8ZLH0_9RHOB|nr:GNAT family N-acetyltransferase [Thalassovita taeanensis]SEP64588.1 Acetyltransferase (GNAT) domain-containing protein [Thalassovita taeanensis]
MECHWSDTAAPTGLPAPLPQSAAYATALTALGRRVIHARLTDSGRDLAQAQLILRSAGRLGTLAYLPRGPVWAQPPSPAQQRTTLHLLRHTLPALGPVALIANAETPYQDTAHHTLGHSALITPQHIATLDLRPDDDTRLATQNPKWRNHLRAAGRKGLRIMNAPLPPDPDHWLLRAEAKQRSIRRYANLPLSLPLTLSRLAPHQTRIFTAWVGETPIAAMLFLLHPPQASYHIGWTGPQGRAASAHHLLLWHASLWLRSKKITGLDLGTLETDINPGLARFKIGSGATARPLGHTWLDAPLVTPLGRLLRPARRLKCGGGATIS